MVYLSVTGVGIYIQFPYLDRANPFFIQFFHHGREQLTWCTTNRRVEVNESWLVAFEDFKLEVVGGEFEHVICVSLRATAGRDANSRDQQFIRNILFSGYVLVSIWISLSLDPTRPTIIVSTFCISPDAESNPSRTFLASSLRNPTSCLNTSLPGYRLRTRSCGCRCGRGTSGRD